MTKAEARRLLVEQLDSEGLDVEEIARRIGASVDEVDRILEQLDAVPHMETVRTADLCGTDRGYQNHQKNDQKPCTACDRAHREKTTANVAAAVRAVRKATTGDVTPIRPARETEPEPVPTKSSPLPVKPSPEPVKPAQLPAAEAPPATPVRTYGKKVGASRTRKPIVHGTYAGYQRETHDGEKPCEACVEAKREYQRDRHAAKKSAPPPTCTESITPQAGPRVVPPPPQKPTVVVQRPRVKVRWLIPRGEEFPAAVHHVDYGLVDERGRIVPCSEAVAEESADRGLRVYRRLVTSWVVVSE